MFVPEAAKRMLLNVSRVLAEHDLNHFLMQGTALGAYRDNGFCPTEKDIDIGVLHECLLPKVPALIQAFIAERYDVEIVSMPLAFPRTIVLWAEGAKCDIVGFMRHKDWRYNFGPYRPWDNKMERYALVHNASIMETYSELELFGRKFLAPSPIEEYLESEYGKDWRTPKDDSVSRRRVARFVERECICPLIG